MIDETTQVLSTGDSEATGTEPSVDASPAPPAGFTKQLVDLARSPCKPLFGDTDVAAEAAALRVQLTYDSAAEVQAEAAGLEEDFRRIQWWQRIRVPGMHCSTTSFPSFLLDMSDPGWLNTLNGALSPEEGRLLRPLPKWAYVRSIMPHLVGKSVLEVGCNNGFFSFAFADELGARSVLGIDVYPGFVAGAQWLLRRRQDKRVEFKVADVMLDMTIPRHDVVFMSEVHGHFVDPFLGILRAINLAKETLVLDGAAGNAAGLEIDLSAGVDPDSGSFTYHAWLLSDGLMMAYLYLCGVEPERVTRYVAPWQTHICYVIDTTNVEEFRRKNDFNPCNTSFLGMKMATGPMTWIGPHLERWVTAARRMWQWRPWQR
jgi:SAM-dependent methyltransferase